LKEKSSGGVRKKERGSIKSVIFLYYRPSQQGERDKIEKKKESKLRRRKKRDGVANGFLSYTGVCHHKRTSREESTEPAKPPSKKIHSKAGETSERELIKKKGREKKMEKEVGSNLNASETISIEGHQDLARKGEKKKISERERKPSGRGGSWRTCSTVWYARRGHSSTKEIGGP